MKTPEEIVEQVKREWRAGAREKGNLDPDPVLFAIVCVMADRAQREAEEAEYRHRRMAAEIT